MVEPSQDLQLVFDKAVKDATKLHHEYVTLEHLLFAMLCDEEFASMLTNFGSDINFIKSNIEHHLKTNCDDIRTDAEKYKPKKTATVERVLNRAFTQVLFAGRSHIQLADVLMSMLSEKRSIAVYWLNESNITREKFAEFINNEIPDESDEPDEMSACLLYTSPSPRD